MSDFKNRHLIETEARPEIEEAIRSMIEVFMGSPTLPPHLPMELFTVASISNVCKHCQVHAAYSLHLMGAETERIRKLWEFETSDLFSDAERAALRFASYSAMTPNAVEPEHIEALREYYSNEQIADILATVSMAAFMNRWNDTIATVTDQESIGWGKENLLDLGWQAGKHTGSDEEQRIAHPFTADAQGVKWFERK